MTESGASPIEVALRALLDAVAPLVDDEASLVAPYWSAWEIDVHSRDPRMVGGEKLHERLAEAYERARAALPDAPTEESNYGPQEQYGVELPLTSGSERRFVLRRDSLFEALLEYQRTVDSDWPPRLMRATRAPWVAVPDAELGDLLRAEGLD